MLEQVGGKAHMYLLYAFGIGALVAFQVLFNGSLGNAIGVYNEAMIVHAVGVFFAWLFLKASHKKLVLDRSLPFWAYLGGCIGVLTVIFQALAFGRISMISISSLTLLGGTLASLFLDSFGLMGMEKRPFNRSTLIGFAFSIAGILVMMDFNEKSSVIPVILSLTAGVVIVISRTINAVLSNSIGALQGSFINHLAGLPITIVLAFLLDGLKLQQASLLFSAPVWTYFGGAIGVVAIACNNVVVPKISAFHFTLLSFLGQMATSILIDLAFGTAANIRSVYGGLLIAAGMILNMLLSRKKEAQA